jgi:hypothetical protein
LGKLDWLLSLVLPKLGARPIGEITAAEILAVLKPVENRGNLGPVDVHGIYGIPNGSQIRFKV